MPQRTHLALALGVLLPIVAGCTAGPTGSDGSTPSDGSGRGVTTGASNQPGTSTSPDRPTGTSTNK